MSDIQGGDFGNGFLSGAVSSLVSSSVIAIGEVKNSLSFYGKTGWSQNTTVAITIAAGGLSGLP